MISPAYVRPDTPCRPVRPQASCNQLQIQGIVKRDHLPCEQLHQTTFSGGKSSFPPRSIHGTTITASLSGHGISGNRFFLPYYFVSDIRGKFSGKVLPYILSGLRSCLLSRPLLELPVLCLSGRCLPTHHIIKNRWIQKISWPFSIEFCGYPL